MALTQDEMDAAYSRLVTSTRNGELRPIDLLELGRDPDTDQQVRLDALTTVQLMRADLERAEHHLLESARAGGATWTALGAALGVTRQGAERRLLRGETTLESVRDADAGRASRRLFTGKRT